MERPIAVPMKRYWRAPPSTAMSGEAGEYSAACPA